MTVGVVGLGLIGGSFAKAYSEGAFTVFGVDTDQKTMDFAQMSGAIHAELTQENIGDCDLILLAVYPAAAIDYLRKMAPYIGKKTIVIDCCGIKRMVCAHSFPIAKEYGFTFVGGHPMAGTHHSGFKYARANMFLNAPMVIVPPSFNDIELLTRVKDLLAPVKFGRISVTTAEKHDEMIAFTSQLAHLVSNAYIKSPTAETHKGFSAGSYKDMTRVAWLNPQMWAELFSENKDNLVKELDILIQKLEEYKLAIQTHDRDMLIRLLDEGRRRKEEVDGR